MPVASMVLASVEVSIDKENTDKKSRCDNNSFPQRLQNQLAGACLQAKIDSSLDTDKAVVAGEKSGWVPKQCSSWSPPLVYSTGPVHTWPHPQPLFPQHTHTQAHTRTHHTHETIYLESFGRLWFHFSIPSIPYPFPGFQTIIL